MSISDRFSSKTAAQRVLVVLFLFAILVFVQSAQGMPHAPNTVFIVNNSGDSPDGDLDDGDCDAFIGTPGSQCTLRAAIEQSNVPNSLHDYIYFSGVPIIAPNTELPALTHPLGVTIMSDGGVYLIGSSLTGGGDGLTLSSNNNEVVGLVILGFDNGIVVNGSYNLIGSNGDGTDDTDEGNVIYSNTGYGIHLDGSFNTVAGNIIGLTPNGSDPGPNTTGIYVSGNTNRIGTDGDGSSDAEERNTISRNTQHGIDISGDNNIVAGNYIGTNAAGDTARANGSNGIDIDPLAAHTRIGTDSDGNGDTAERNVISGNGGDGIKSKGDYVTITGNYIGSDVTGASALPNGGYGVAVAIGAYETLIGSNGDGTRDSSEGNLISGNTTGGIEISGDIHDTRIAGNMIGTNPTGTTALPNQGDGIYAQGIGDDLMIGMDGDGLGDVDQRNIISGNGGDGIHLSTGISYAVLAGNYIGTNASGSTAIGNGGNGVLVAGGASDNLIGTDEDNTADTLERNLISGNGGSGVRIEGVGSDQNQLAGNYIGTNVSGNGALPNLIGVRVDDQAADTMIAPDYDIIGNLISGNFNDGIHLGANVDSTFIRRNIIGLNYLGTVAMGNGRNGIYLTEGAFDSEISANTIAENSGAGIFMTSSAGSENYYYINRIYSNGGLGVDLAPMGVNLNDPGDADSGPNDLMNYPEFRRVVRNNDDILFEGVLNSEPDTNYAITFYQVETCDPSGHGEGGSHSYTGGTSIRTDASGQAVFATAIGGFDPVIPYMVVSNGLSEFSECFLVESGPYLLPAQLSIADSSLEEGNSGSSWMNFDVTLDRSASITVTVRYGISSETAVIGEDLVASSGEISFSPGTTQQTVSIEILGDTTVEPHETFRVSLNTPAGASIQDSQAIGTILDDDGIGDYRLFLPLTLR